MMTVDSPKPQRGQFKEDYEGWRKHFTEERKKFRLNVCLMWCNIPYLMGSYLFDYPEKWNKFGISHIIILSILAFIWWIIGKVVLLLSLYIIPISEQKIQENAIWEADQNFRKALGEWEDIQNGLDGLEERRTMREIKSMRMRGQIEDEIALTRYAHLQTIQHSQNQQLIYILNQAIQASNSGNYQSLNNNLNQLEKELGL